MKIKKTAVLGILNLILLLTSCVTTEAANASRKDGKKDPINNVKFESGKAIISNVDFEEDVVDYGKNVDGFENVTVIDCAKSKNRNFVKVDLTQFQNQEVFINFSCDLKFECSTASEADINWMINEIDANFPEIAREKIPVNEWVHFSGNKLIVLGEKRQFYISGSGLDKDNLIISIKNFDLQISGDEIGTVKEAAPGWTQVPSLAETYKNCFDYFGFAIPSNLLNNATIQDGLKYQASCITMENEFKPDFMFAWQKPSQLQDFIAENGKTYSVPVNTPVLGNIGNYLRTAKKLNLKLRGHVLVWHSQTPEWFFRESYGSNKENFVDKETMNARMEWYIKTILEYIADWETKYNDGEHIVVTWDVVNEAASDNSTASAWLRNDSNWYRIYKNDEFIVNAFRYANKYAPKDVKLAYNDYGCSSVVKCEAICKIIDAIQAAPDARIDVMGMQSHVGMNTPVTGSNSFETSVQKFLSKGIDVQITELDIAQDGQRYNAEAMKLKYKQFFQMFINNRKTNDKNGICGVTIWGLVDERSWIYNNNGVKQHPLLFEGNYIVKPAFYGVIEAAQEAGL